MTYIVNESCIKCKLMDCVEVCHVDCFYEGENMLVIHPDECIDCGVCETECPVEAIKPDTEAGAEKWLKLNADYAKTWPNITIKRDPPANSKEWEGKPDKLKYFSPNPGAGDLVRGPMSALPLKADMCSALSRCPLSARSGHCGPLAPSHPPTYGVEIRPVLVATIRRLPHRKIETILPTPGTVSPRVTRQVCHWARPTLPCRS